MNTTKHILAGIFGPTGSSISPAAGERLTEIDFLAPDGSLNRGVGHALESLRELGSYPTEAGIEALLLSTLVYAADTRISRATESEDGWTRRIRVVMPVAEPAVWAEASASLSPMLNFLTGDRWEVEFVQRPASVAGLATDVPADWESPGYATVSLFSGGMDSLIGAIDQLSEAHRPLLVGHAGDSATSKAQGSACPRCGKRTGKRASPC